jgi:hypothetical protein
MSNIDLSVLETVAKNQERLIALMENQNGDHTKAPANTATYTELHGLGGIFSSPGMEREVISTHVRPYGIASELPKFGTVYEDPTFGALTGISDDQGSEPLLPCNDAPDGFIKACNLTARFGRVARDTQTIEMDKVMLRVNRGDFTDLRLVGQVLGLTELYPQGLNQTQILNLVTMSEMIQAAVRLERKLCEHVWVGDVANNNPGGGYKEFPGLDQQIATGQVDADTNDSCPSLDADVKDFDYNDVCGTTQDIVDVVSAMEFFVRSLAEDTGMMPARWVWVMRPQLWQELTSCWPCKYNTNKCTSIGGDHRVLTDGRENITDRDNMRQGKYLDVNGVRYPVILDNCIYEQNSTNDSANLNPGEFASSIYFVPLTVTGNFPVTYMEYLDYRQAAADVALMRGREDFWTDRGQYSWAVEQTKWCYKFSLKSEQRIVLRTPQLSGKIDNVRYSPLQHIRDPLPDNSHWIDGGVSIRSEGTRYMVWG